MTTKPHKFTEHQVKALQFFHKNLNLCMTLSAYEKYGIYASAVGALARRGYLESVTVYPAYWVHEGWEPVAWKPIKRRIKEALESLNGQPV
jgi:hypothetical protein